MKLFIKRSEIPQHIKDFCFRWFEGLSSEMYNVALTVGASDEDDIDLFKLLSEFSQFCYNVECIPMSHAEIAAAHKWVTDQIEFLGWFCNAVQAGYDAARNKYENKENLT